MSARDNYLKNAELCTEQNYNMIDRILNNAPPQLPQPGEKTPDKVRELPNPRSREREER